MYRRKRGIDLRSSNSRLYSPQEYSEASWAAYKRNIQLLFFDYVPNGSLSLLLHGAETTNIGENGKSDITLFWVAHALAYLHHDCHPPIIHRDVKTLNVLLGPEHEPYLADFGLAVSASNSEMNERRHFVGSYKYMAPGMLLICNHLMHILILMCLYS